MLWDYYVNLVEHKSRHAILRDLVDDNDYRRNCFISINQNIVESCLEHFILENSEDNFLFLSFVINLLLSILTANR